MLERLAPFFESTFRKTHINPKKINRFLQNQIVQHYLKKYQLHQLKQTLKYCNKNSAFYHKLFKEHNIEPTQIKNFEDMVQIPFTTSQDLKDPTQFFCVPESQFVRVFSTSGTSGTPKRSYQTQKDVDQQISRNATGMALLYDVDHKDRCRITYDIGLGINDFGIRICVENAVKQLGALGIVTGKRLPPEQELELFKLYRFNVLMGTISYIYQLSTELSKLIDLTTFNMKCLLISSEPLPKAIRETLEELWHTNVYQGYGLTEVGTSVAGECKEKNGMHITESDFYVEIIDPDTGQLLKDGEIGEVVITNINREGMPLIRYKTKDLGVIMTEKCPCGIPFKRIKIKGRTDDMVPIGSGDNLYCTKVDELLFSMPQVKEYQLILTRKNNKDHIKLTVESKTQSKTFKIKIEQALMSIPEVYDGVMNSRTILKPEIHLVPPKTIVKTAYKTKRLLDKRNLYE